MEAMSGFIVLLLSFALLLVDTTARQILPPVVGQNVREKEQGGQNINQGVDNADWSNYKNHSSAFRKWIASALETYEDRLRPQFGVSPLNIKLGLVLISVSSISEGSMEFTVEMFLHETWWDDRLTFDPRQIGSRGPITLPLNAPSRLWTPDTTFLNALRSQAPQQGSISHLHYMKLHSNGTIAYSRRISVTAECPMDLTMYPFDQQACWLEISSYGWTVGDITYEWELTPGSINLKNLLLPDFEPQRYTTTVFNRPYDAGNFSIAKLCIVLKRRSGFCFLQLFVPATAVVGSSWISLWLESETQFADMVAVILAIIFLSYSYNTVMPKVSYIKAMDIYLGACFIFAFLSLVKLAIVKYMHKRVIKRKERQHEAMLAATALPAALANALTHTGEVDMEEGMKLLNLDGGINHSVDLSPAKKSPMMTAAHNHRGSRVSIYKENNHHDVYWRCMKAFHVISQLALPLAFGAFGVFYFFIYPHVKTQPAC